MATLEVGKPESKGVQLVEKSPGIFVPAKPIRILEESYNYVPSGTPPREAPPPVVVIRSVRH